MSDHRARIFFVDLADTVARSAAPPWFCSQNGCTVTRRRARMLLSAVTAVFLAAPPFPAQIASAGTYYWDTSPSTAVAGNGVLNGGTGNWDNATANFTTSPTDAAATIHNVWSSILNNAGTDTVIFGGTAGTVTANTFASGGQLTGSTALGISNLTFNTTGYTLGGTQSLRFIGTGAITLGSGVTAAINNTISSAAITGYAVDSNIDVSGAGTLKLGGTGASVGFTLSSSVLQTTAAGVLSGVSSINGTGTLDMNGTAQTAGTIGGSLATTNLTSAGTATLNLSLAGSAQTYAGVMSDSAGKLSLAITGVFSQSAGTNLSNSLVTQTLAGANTYTGSTSLGRSTLALDFSNAGAPATNILYNAGFGASPSGDDGTLVITQPTATVNGTALSAIGTLANLTLVGKASTTNSQSFNGVRLDANASASVLINPNTTANTVTLDLGSTVTRETGSVINFATTSATTALSANATVATTVGVAGSTLLDGNGIAYATLGGRDWAAKDAGNTFLVPATYTGAGKTSLVTSADITTIAVGGLANDTTLSADTVINTLRFASTSDRSVINLGGKVLTVGGILVSTVADLPGNALNGGSVRTPGTDLVLMHFAGSAGNWFNLGASVVDGPFGTTGFTKGGTGVSVLSAATNTFSGTLSVQQGGLIVTGANTPATVIINGGAVNLAGAELPGANTAGTYLQIGNNTASGTLGTADVNIGPNAILAIKRTDALTLNNAIHGLGGLTQGGTGTTTLLSAAAAKYTYAGDTTVTAGTLKLDYAASNTGVLSDSSQLVLGGGALLFAGVGTTTHNEIVRGVSLLPGASTLDRSGGTGTLRLNAFGAGGTGGPTGVGATLNLTAASIADTDTSNIAGILAPGGVARVTVGKANWAVSATTASDTPITALATYTTLTATTGTNTNNSLLTTSGPILTGNLTTNTLKINYTVDDGTSTFDPNGRVVTLTAGGLLFTGTLGFTIGSTAGGTLRSGSPANSDLVIHQYNTDPFGLNIACTIADGNGPSSLTKTGPGDLDLTGINTYTGPTYLNGGVTFIDANNRLGAEATGASLNLNNASLEVTASVVLSSGGVLGTANRAINLNGVGGTLIVDADFTLTVAGVVGGPGSLTKAGSGTLTLAGSNTFSGSTNVFDGTLKLGFDTSVAPATNIISGNSPLVLGGGNLLLTGKTSTTNRQTFNGTSVQFGQSSVTLTPNIIANPLVLNLGNLTRSAGGTVDFVLPASTQSSTNGITTTASNTNGILGPWATVAGKDFAAVSGGNIVAYTGYTDVTRLSSGSKTIADGAASNVRILDGTNAAGNLTLGAAGSTINTLNQSASGAATIDPAGKSLSVNAILMGPTAGRLTIGTGTNNGTLKSPGTELILNNNSASDMMIRSAVTNGASGVSVVKVGIGSVELAGANTFTGTASVLKGTLTVSGSLSTSSTVGVYGGTLYLRGANTMTGSTLVNDGALVATHASAFNPTTGGAVTINEGATLNYAAVANSPLSMHSTLTINGGEETYIGGAVGSTTTSAQINVTGAATATGNVAVNVFGIPNVTPAVGTTTYTLLHAGAGSNLNAATIYLGTVYNNSNFTAGTIANTATDITIPITRVTALTNVYWRGTFTTNIALAWSASDGAFESNWASTPAGAVQALVPGPTTNVFISANPILDVEPVDTYLGADMTIRTLTIQDTVNGMSLIADGNTLTITPATSTTGITVNASVPASSIAADIALGAAQTWTINSANAFTVSGNVLAGANVLTVTGTGPTIISGVVSGTAGLTKSGTGTLTLSGDNTLTGSITVTGGTLDASAGSITSSTGAMSVTGSGSQLIAAKIAPSSLTVGAGAKIKLTNIDNPADLSGRSTAATWSNSGLVDVGKTGIVIASATEATIRAQIIAGRNAGAWTGTSGITSSDAIANPSSRAVGYFVNGAQIAVARTAIGDANLDSTVNIDDLSLLAQNYNLTSRNWQTGDFNYDGVVNIDDLSLLAQNYNLSASDSPAGAITGDVNAQFSSDLPIVFNAPSVPEPTSAGLLGLSAIGLLAQRRRRK